MERERFKTLPHHTQVSVPSLEYLPSGESPLKELLLDGSPASVKTEPQEASCPKLFKHIRGSMVVMPCPPTAAPVTISVRAVDDEPNALAMTGPAVNVETVIPPLCLKVDSMDRLGEAAGWADTKEKEWMNVREEEEGVVVEEEEEEAEVEVVVYGEQSLWYEHSYSRQGLRQDREQEQEQLWSRIAALHAKITRLEQREDETLACIQTAEEEIAHLRKKRIVFEEKCKTLEEYFKTVSMS